MVVTSTPAKYVLMFIAIFIFVEIVLLNAIILYGYASLKNSVSPIFNSRSNNLLDVLGQYRMFQDVVKKGKSGGFVSLMQETLERLFVIMPKEKSDGGRINKLSLIGLDVSQSGEATFIYKRIMSRKKFEYTHLVVDIGATDGLVSSNSFNFIQWGWNAILVEPHKEQLEMAKKNIQRYIDPYKELNHSVRFVQAVLGDKDGTADLVVATDLISHKSHILRDDEIPPFKSTVKVPSMTVQTFIRNLHVPQFFGLLSVDTMGVGIKVLTDFISMGFRPAYVIYEHESEDTWKNTARYLAGHEYKCLTKRGNNFILEHVPLSNKTDNINSYMYTYY